MRQALFFAFALAVLSSCGGGDTASPDDNRSCDAPLTDSVQASDDAREALGVARFRYRFPGPANQIEVDLLGEDGNPSGRLSLEFDSGLVATSDDATATVGDLRGTMEFGEERLSFEVATKMEFAGFRTQFEHDGISVERPSSLVRVMELTIDGKSVLIANRFPLVTESLGFDEYSAFLVPVDGLESRPAHSVDSGVFATGEAGEVVPHYALTLVVDGEVRSEEEIEQFLLDSERDAFVRSKAVQALMIAFAEDEWLERAQEHLISCALGDDFEFEQAEASATGALTFAEGVGCAGAAWGSYRTLKLSRTCAASLFAPDYGLAKSASCGAVAVSGTLAYVGTIKCLCNFETLEEFVDCGKEPLLDCINADCEEKCRAVIQPPCGRPLVTRGSCVEYALAGVSGSIATQPVCACTLPDLPGGQIGCTGGDPNVFTFDGLRYAAQLPGEFIYLRDVSGDSDLEIQVRQLPTNESALCATTSVNTAFAIRYKGTVVQLDVRNSPRLLRNSDPYDFFGQAQVGEGMAVIEHGNGYRFRLDNEVVVSIDYRRDTIDVTVTGVESTSGAFVGMFGNANSDVSDDLSSRSGTVVPSTSSERTFTDQFLGSWQVEPGESLFTYNDGDSVESYRGVFVETVQVEDLDSTEADEARRVCAEAGVEDSVIPACIVDVICLEDPSVAKLHGQVAPNEVARFVDGVPINDWLVGGQPVDWTPLEGDGVFTLGHTFYATYFLSPQPLEQERFQFVAIPGGGNDFFGLAFGVPTTIPTDGAMAFVYDMYVVGWVGEAETPGGRTAPEGMYLARFSGDFQDENSARLALWAPDDPQTDASKVEVLATARGPGSGWESRPYVIDVTYSESTGISIAVDAQTVLGVAAAELPTSYAPGHFGFISISQPMEFGNFSAFDE